MAHTFGHREHLQVAWRNLEGRQVDQAVAETASIIRAVAQAHGAPDKYHHTITEAWIRLIAHHRAAEPELDFAGFVERYPAVLDKQLLGRHWSAERLTSAEARAGWVEPDLLALPSTR